jgi:hypothetical protein
MMMDAQNNDSGIYVDTSMDSCSDSGSEEPGEIRGGQRRRNEKRVRSKVLDTTRSGRKDAKRMRMKSHVVSLEGKKYKNVRPEHNEEEYVGHLERVAERQERRIRKLEDVCRVNSKVLCRLQTDVHELKQTFYDLESLKQNVATLWHRTYADYYAKYPVNGEYQ